MRKKQPKGFDGPIIGRKKEFNTDEPDFIYDLVREDGRLERVCKHGIGHTVGHQDSQKLKDDYIWVHGCDGCCRNYKKMADKQPQSDCGEK